jgi:hypothetical protein
MTELPAVDGQARRRAFSRLQLGISARLETLDGRQKIRLIDLSQAGAHVVVLDPSDFREGVLTWMNFETFGDVAWRDGNDIGLKFDKLLPLGVLVETRQRAPHVVREEAEAAARAFVAGTYNPGS